MKYFLTVLLLAASLPSFASERCLADDPDASCLGLSEKDAALDPAKNPRSVLGKALKSCSTKPVTGWLRDGYCRTDSKDRGVHVVCAEMSDDFLKYTKAQGNDLSTPNPRFGFAGLKAGDRWCLCASRWEQARKAGKAPRVILDASEEKTLKFTTMKALKKHGVDQKKAR